MKSAAHWHCHPNEADDMDESLCHESRHGIGFHHKPLNTSDSLRAMNICRPKGGQSWATMPFDGLLKKGPRQVSTLDTSDPAVEICIKNCTNCAHKTKNSVQFCSKSSPSTALMQPCHDARLHPHDDAAHQCLALLSGPQTAQLLKRTCCPPLIMSSRQASASIPRRKLDLLVCGRGKQHAFCRTC